MNYGYPRRLWETDPPGGHGGYTRPAWAFVPSIGISNPVQPSAEEFPLWGKDDLLVGSLRAGTLFHVRTDGAHVAYVEPLSLDGERLRDIISMTDGRIVILTDSGNLILMPTPKSTKTRRGNSRSQASIPWRRMIRCRERLHPW